MHKSFNLHIPISKIDEEQRMVYGVATSEMVDSQGDIIDYEASKVAFSDWLGNIREMHQPVAVGKAIDVQFDDENKQVHLGVKLSESADGENAWIKVKEGVLQGFSIGGSVSQVKKETAKKNGVDVPVTRVTQYSLSETSLVDNPACPDALFEMVKSVDGGLQRVEHTATAAEIKKEFRLPAWHVQFMLPMEKAQALYNNSMKKGSDIMAKKENLKKGMWDASFLLDLAIELNYYIQSEEYEGEDVTELLAALATIKGAVVTELTEPTTVLTSAVELAEKLSNLKKEKGADMKKSTAVGGGEERNAEAEVVATAEENGRPVNDTTERAAEAGVPAAGAVITDKNDEPVLDAEGNPVVQAPVHADGTAAANAAAAAEAQAATGAEADKADETAAADAKGKPSAEADPEAEKSVTVGDLKKFSDGLIEKLGSSSKEELSKALGEFTGKVEKAMSSLEGRVKTLEDQPAALKGKASFATITKGEDGAEEGTAEVKELTKRRDELAANPNLGTPEERMDIAGKLRKFARAGLDIK